MTLLTEQEAMTQRCIGPEGCGLETPDESDPDYGHCVGPCPTKRLCIGSACKMAWRWADGDEQTIEQPPKVDMGPGWANCGPVADGDNLWKRAGSNRLGYCGIAGRPE
jgi:hypothetical protein